MARSEPSSQRQSPAALPHAEPLTEIERKILDFMVQYLRANTYQPSIREIGRRFGIKSTKTVSEHLHTLAEKGYLERDSSRSRGVRILGVDLSTDTVAVPCFSELPRSPEEAALDGELPRISIDRRLGGEDGSFFLRAGPGDLAVLGIEEGDLVLVAPVSSAQLGEGAVVVARTGSPSLFHRLRRNGRGVTLESLGPDAERIVVEDPDDLTLFGRVAGFYRKLDEAGVPALTRH